MKSILVTGSAGLVGSAVCYHFHKLGYHVYGVDNNQRGALFGQAGSVDQMRRRLMRELRNYNHLGIDIRSASTLTAAVSLVRPTVIVHAAGQPSHDKSAKMPLTDFHINAVGTLNLLEAARKSCPESPFVFMSTNKVYGDNPNKLGIIERETRFDFSGSPLQQTTVFNEGDHFRSETVVLSSQNGVNEKMGVDQCTHSPFGASKLAADVMVQEYGRYYGMPTVCLRAGCITGANHAGVELHGFLNYLVRCMVQGSGYTIYGYKGKQVRDNLHACDVASFIEQFAKSPRRGEVYNIGGGKENSCSILEALQLVQDAVGSPNPYSGYVCNEQPRVGDHICYYTDLTKIKSHYPDWSASQTLRMIISEIVYSYEKGPHSA